MKKEKYKVVGKNVKSLHQKVRQVINFDVCESTRIASLEEKEKKTEEEKGKEGKYFVMCFVF